VRIRLVLALALGLVPAAGGAGAPARIAAVVSSPQGSNVVLLGADATGLHVVTSGPAGEAENPAWSPDGSKLAFDSQGNASTQGLYVVDADGSSLRRLTSTIAVSPAWSTDGSRLAYRTGGDIWVIDADGSAQRAVATDQGQQVGIPEWQPHGSLILYERTTSNGIDVRLVDADAGGPRTLVSTHGFAVPQWSPDGKRVAYADGRVEVATLTGDVRAVSDVLATAAVAWSPDGRTIAFDGRRPFTTMPSRFGPPTMASIYVAHVDGTGTQRLTGPLRDQWEDGAADRSPVWWPDGSRLLFDRFGQNGFRLWTMNADGSCEHELDSGLPVLTQAAFQPVGTLPVVGDCVDLHAYAAFESSVAGKGAPQPLTVTIDNDGDQPADGVVAVATASSGTVHSYGRECSGTGPSIQCALPRLPPESSMQLDLTVATDRVGGETVAVRVAGALPVSAGESVLACRRVGSAEPDTIFGTKGRDTICGLTGADHIYGRGGGDLLDGGAGDDVVYGGPGRDVIAGKGGRDVIFARDGERDIVDCGTERDTAVVDRVDVVRDCERVLRQ
jgi:Tol biopolymer transport system component